MTASHGSEAPLVTGGHKKDETEDTDFWRHILQMPSASLIAPLSYAITLFLNAFYTALLLIY